MAAILFVRIKSDLDPEEFGRRLLERRPRFRDVPGLVQKIYGRDQATGEVCGIYFFETEEALTAFRETELAERFRRRIRRSTSGARSMTSSIHSGRNGGRSGMPAA